jgi:hypothetical protein
MSNKMTCPGCNSHTSAVLSDYMAGDPCRYCGLSASATEEILAVRRSVADEALKARLEEVLRKFDEADRRAAGLERKLSDIRRVLG